MFIIHFFRNNIKFSFYFKTAIFQKPIITVCFFLIWKFIFARNYNDSLEFYRKALSLNPTNASTWTSIGLTSIFLNKFDEAIEYFHQALWYKKTDLVAKKLLEKCLNLVKDHSSLALTDEFQMDITDIMLTKQQQLKSKSKLGADLSDSITFPVKSLPDVIHGVDESAMDLAMDSVLS